MNKIEDLDFIGIAAHTKYLERERLQTEIRRFKKQLTEKEVSLENI